MNSFRQISVPRWNQNLINNVPKTVSEINLKNDWNFKSAGRITEDGYEIEFIIPFSEIPFPNGKKQAWKIKIFSGYIDDDNEGGFDILELSCLFSCPFRVDKNVWVPGVSTDFRVFELPPPFLLFLLRVLLNFLPPL